MTEILIQAVKDRPILYLTSHPDYKNIPKKQKAWIAVQEETDIDAETAKVKWKSLRDTYKKYKHSQTSSGSRSSKRYSNWTWADQMEFIDYSIPLECVQSNIDTEEASDVDANSPDEDKDEENRDSENVSIKSGKRVDTSKKIRKGCKRKPDPRGSMCPYLESRESPPRNNPSAVQVPCDSTDMLFLGYAATFKKLSRRSRVTVKYEIAKVLMQAELQDIGDCDSNSNPPTPIISEDLNVFARELTINLQDHKVQPP